MVNLQLSQDVEALSKNHIIRTVYDPCCGSGGMLTTAKERIHEINQNAEAHLFGQEVNPETFAVKVDGVHATVPPATSIALNQLYFFS
jgi:type I restriction enzyme M protein